MKTGFIPSVLLGFLVGGFVFAVSAAETDVVRISPKQLKERLGSPDTVVLDVRSEKDWQESKFKIKGASRQEPSNFEQWAHTYDKDTELVLY